MKIAIVGCGALGSYYGAKLCRDAQDVHFLLRSDFAAVRRRGVSIKSAEGDFNVRPHCACRPEDIGPCDLVIIGLKTTANDQFASLLPPLVAEHTAILTLQNGLGSEALLAAQFGAEKILGGLCFVCLNRLEPGVIHHLAHGKIVMGEFERWPEPRTHDIASLIRHAGVPCKVTDNLAQARWEKLIWNIPFNGLGVASAAGFDACHHGVIANHIFGPCLSTDRLLADARWEALIRELMAEVVAAAAALGHHISPEFCEKQIANTRTMGPYKASTVIDYERHQPLELASLFLEPLRQARQVGVSMPRLSTLCAVLEKLAPPPAIN